MVSVREKDVLKLLVDGPTLEKLTQRINQESPEVSSKSVGEVLVALQNKGCVFLEEGRWWRTPEGIAFLEKLLADESSEVAPKGPKEFWPVLLRTTSLHFHGFYYTDVVVIMTVATSFMWSAILAHGGSTFGGDIPGWLFYYRVLRDSLLRLGEFPLWNPYYFGGMPYLANPQTSPLYFSSLPLLLFGEADGIRWTVILHLILSGLNMYYLMSTLKQRRVASLLSAVGYMLSGYMVARIAGGHLPFVYGYSWVPLAFAFCAKAATTGKLPYAIVTGVVLMLQFQSGGLVILCYTLLLLAFYLVYYCLVSYWNDRGLLREAYQYQSPNNGEIYSRIRFILAPVFRYGSTALVIALVFLSLSAVKLIPLIEFALQTGRIGERGGITGGIPDIQALYNVLLERNVQKYHDIYGHGWWEFCSYLGCMVFLGIAAPFVTRRKRHTVFFSVVALLGIIFAMGPISPFFPFVRYVYDNIPLFSVLLHLPARFLFLTVFSISVLSGIAVSAISDRIGRSRGTRLINLDCLLPLILLAVIILDMGFFAAPHFRTYPDYGAPSAQPYTSLTPHDLSARWMEYPANITARLGEPFDLHVKVRNIGDTIWLKDSGQPIGPGDPWYLKRGTVNLGVFVADVGYRYRLSKDVLPGDEMELTVAVPSPAKPGKYTLKMNLVVELVTWFNPPYPLGDITVVTFLDQRSYVAVAKTPINSHSDYHALLWLSNRISKTEYVRIGGMVIGVNEIGRLGLFQVGGYETGGMELQYYLRFISRPSYKVLGLLNAKYIVSRSQESNNTDLQFAYDSDPWFIYENKRFLPRSYCVEHAVLTVGTDEDVFPIQDYLVNAEYFDPSRVALIRGRSLHDEDYELEFLRRFDLVVVLHRMSDSERNSLSEKCKQANVAVIEYTEGLEQALKKSVTAIRGRAYTLGEIVHYSPNKVVVKVRLDAPGFLILSEVSYQGWKAYVDGKEAPIMSAYSTLRSVFLDRSGEHEISFIYQPASYVVGASITLAAFLVIVAIVVRPRLRFLSYRMKEHFR